MNVSLFPVNLTTLPTLLAGVCLTPAHDRDTWVPGGRLNQTVTELSKREHHRSSFRLGGQTLPFAPPLGRSIRQTNLFIRATEIMSNLIVEILDNVLGTGQGLMISALAQPQRVSQALAFCSGWSCILQYRVSCFQLADCNLLKLS